MLVVPWVSAVQVLSASSLESLRDRVWPPMEPALADAGREGELVIGRARVGLTLLFLLSPIATLARHPDEPPGWLALGLAGIFLVAGMATVRLATRQTPPVWLGLATTVTDVSLVTLYHAMIFASGFPLMALTSRVTFSVYVLVIIATGLRYDGRLCVVAGMLAGLEWLGVVAWAAATGYADAALRDGRFYGDVGPGGQIEELVVMAVATSAALIIVDRARTLRLSSVRDDLTHLLNRSYFEERVALELERMSRHQRPLALAILDLDQFKPVNDTWGHAAGDIVLRETAARIKRLVRRTDLVARLGGDEFVIVLPETSVADATAKLEEIRHALRFTPIDVGAGSVSMTFSAGIAAAGPDGLTTQLLLGVADRRLLAAKREGRDRISASSAQRSPAPNLRPMPANDQ